MKSTREQDVLYVSHKGATWEILIDAEDKPFLSIYKWNLKEESKNYYARTAFYINGKQKSVYMHRLLTGMKSCFVDHINFNTLDNRKSNLRLVDKAQSARHVRKPNPTGYRGVVKKRNKYAIQITHNYKKYTKGGFSTPEEAAKYYDKLSEELHGEHGIKNFKS